MRSRRIAGMETPTFKLSPYSIGENRQIERAIVAVADSDRNRSAANLCRLCLF